MIIAPVKLQRKTQIYLKVLKSYRWMDGWMDGGMTSVHPCFFYLLVHLFQHQLYKLKCKKNNLP